MTVALEGPAETFSNLAEVCGQTTVRTTGRTVKERPRRETFQLPEWRPLEILRSFLLAHINQRKQRLKSGRSLSSVGRESSVGSRLLYGRLVVLVGEVSLLTDDI